MNGGGWCILDTKTRLAVGEFPSRAAARAECARRNAEVET